MTLSKNTTRLSNLQVRPIGRVRNRAKIDTEPPACDPKSSGGPGGRNPLSWSGDVSELVIHKRFSEALDGLEEFSHILLFFWSGNTDETIPWNKRFRMKFRPTGREDFPLVGVLATRSPFRPNPIAATAVELLQRKGNVLTVRGLDTFDGTPIIDIKPYIPYYDSITDVKMADWINKLVQLFRPQTH